MKKTVILVLVIALMGAAEIAWAQGWGRGPGYGGGPGYGPGAGGGPCGMGYGPGYGPRAGWQGLNLSPEQSQKIQGIRDGFAKETLPLRNEMQVKQLELRTLWAQTNPDQDKILAKQKEINALRTQLQEKSTRFRLEARKVLTPEQQAQIGTYGPGMGMGFGPGRGMGYGRGMGSGCPRW